MTKKMYGNKITFEEAQIKAFDKVKKALSDCTDLFAPRYDKPFILRTDSPDTCIGGVLSQEGYNGDGEFSMMFLSSKLTGSMLQWGVLEKESYATIWCLKKVEHIIWGNRVKLFVDNNPLFHTMNARPSSSKLMRWSLALSKLRFII